MQEQLSTRAERTAAIGQDAMKTLFKQPIKEAVKETLAEEQLVSRQAVVRATDDTETTAGELPEEKSEDSDTALLDPKLLLSALALIGVAIALRRLGTDPLESESIGELIGREESVPMEEDMSKSSPADPENAELSDDGSEQLSA